jgi:tetratricopeptide (TPR) repeat protein
MSRENRGDDWQALLHSGTSLLRAGQVQQALNQLQRAERLAPGQRDVRYWLGNAFRMAGQGHKARALFEEILAESPADFETSFALAFLLRDTGAPGEAAAVLVRAGRQPGVSVYQLLQLAGFLRDSSQFAAAIEVCEKAADKDTDRPDIHFKLARLYQATGAFERALDSLHRTLDLAPATGPAWVALAQQTQFSTADSADFLRMQQAAAQSHGREADTCIAFAFGKALNDLQRWAEAWAQYSKGNRLMSETLPWHPAAWSKFVDQALTRRVTEPTSAGNDRKAVFIVGMPRSGTTLLEQMLDRHPAINGRGELNFLAELAVQSATLGPLSTDSRRQMANTLWTQMRLDGSESGVYVDKNPLNFRHLGLLFDLLPTARVLHLVRDGRDSCLSCYFQLFQHADTAFTYKLDHLVEFYAGYRHLMAHWESCYPGRILQIDYDDLVGSTRPVLAGALRFLGVDWDDALLQTGGTGQMVRSASVWQARQPVHERSLGRWRNYYEQAPEFFDRLSAIDAGYARQ